MQFSWPLNAPYAPVIKTLTRRSVTFTADGRGVEGYHLDEPMGRFPQFQFPIAVMDIGSNYIKALILTPDGVLNVQKFPSPFGQWVQQKQALQPEDIQAATENIKTCQDFIRDAGVDPKHVKAYGTESLRGLGKSGKHLAKQLGIHILTGKEEGALLYKGILRNHPKVNAMIFEAGGGSTEWAFAKSKHNQMFELGTTRSQPANPFSQAGIAGMRKTIRKQFKTVSTKQTQKIRRSMGIKRLYITPSDNIRAFGQTLYQKDISKTPLTRAELKGILKKANNREWVIQHSPPTSPQEVTERLPLRLSLLYETMRALKIKELAFGSEGGLKMALLMDWADTIAKKEQQTKPATTQHLTLLG